MTASTQRSSKTVLPRYFVCGAFFVVLAAVVAGCQTVDPPVVQQALPSPPENVPAIFRKRVPCSYRLRHVNKPKRGALITIY